MISKDVIFEEDECWDWGRSIEELKLDVLDWGESEDEDGGNNSESEDEDGGNDNLEGGENSNIEGDLVASSASSQSSEDVQEEGRNRRPPDWMKDYVSGEGLSGGKDVQNFVLFTSASDTSTFEEAIKSDKWRTAMDNEIEAIEKNGT